VIVPDASGAATRVGVSVRRVDLCAGDVVWRRGFPVTSIPRTLVDLVPNLGLVETVVVADMALNRRKVEVAELCRWAHGRIGRKGVKALRRVIELMDEGAESPMESRLRLLLVLAGLERPLVQAALDDEGGNFVGRADLYYPVQRLAIEYDGQVHRESLVEDSRRQNRLLNAGYRLLRFTAADVFATPDKVVAQVRSGLDPRAAHPRASAAYSWSRDTHSRANAAV